MTTNHCPKCGSTIGFTPPGNITCAICGWRGSWANLVKLSVGVPKDSVVEEILRERGRQSGGNKTRDENRTKNDWVAVVCAHAGRAAQVDVKEQCSFRRSMITVAATALAAIEIQDSK